MMGATEIKVMGPKERLDSEGYCVSLEIYSMKNSNSTSSAHFSNNTKLQKIIEEFYLPAAKKLYGFNCRLVQDNASVHTSAYTKKRLEEMKVKVSLQLKREFHCNH